MEAVTQQAIASIFTQRARPPFRGAHSFRRRRLDALLDEAGIDALVVSSKHNIQYLFGGYRFFFFDHFDAIGVSRYLPILVYVKGQPELAAYIGHPMESYERELGKFWVPTSSASRARASTGRSSRRPSRQARAESEAHRRRARLPAGRRRELLRGTAQRRIRRGALPLERLRARKTPQELDYLRKASELVVDSMLAVIAAHGPGATKLELAEALRREEVNRGLTFEYCLITAGTSLNRAPSDQVWGEGDILSLDSGGNYKGYIGDLCRMAIQGEPDSELEDLLGEVDAIQMAARKPIRRRAGRRNLRQRRRLVRKVGHGNSLEFVAHGMGLVSHEAPRLTGPARCPIPLMTSTGRWRAAWSFRSRRRSSIRAAASSSSRTPWRSPKAAAEAFGDPAAAGTGGGRAASR